VRAQTVLAAQIRRLCEMSSLEYAHHTRVLSSSWTEEYAKGITERAFKCSCTFRGK